MATIYADPHVSAAALSTAKTRLALFALGCMIGYFAVCLRLVDLTLLQPPGEARASAAPVRPLRSDIVDRNGMLVATSLKMDSVYADATLVTDPGALAAALVKILPDEDKTALVEKLSSGKKFVWIRRDVTPHQVYALNALGSPALNFQREQRRIYPDGALAAHVTGYTDLDGAGIAGMERAFEEDLAKGGAPVRLALDMRLQHIVRSETQAAMRKFSAKGAAAVVMDVNTGEILSLVSLPDFDPNHQGEAVADAKFNRATLGVFEMGSTFKVFSTAAALDAGVAQLSSTYDATEAIKFGKFRISDYHAKKRVMTVPEIFIHSSNIGTARMAMDLPQGALKGFYKKLGFLDEVPVKLPENGQPLVPRNWSDITTMTTSFGHGLAVTPVHVVRAVSAVVNGGTLVAPRLVLSEDAPVSRLPAGPRVLSAATSKTMRDLLSLTVATGTGGNAAAEGYDVGGKTGTAEKNIKGRYVKDKVMSSFLGVFPMAEPRYAVLVMIDEPKPIAETHGYVTGGWTAAPVVGRIVSRMAPLYGMPPETETRDILDDMGKYLKDVKRKKGTSVASAGTDR